ncbi:hypothetical protein PG984_006438 [Apiospora sp. TS-2023a]
MKDPAVAEKQRKHFKNKQAPPLRKALFEGILRSKIQLEEELEDVGFSSDEGDNCGLTPAIRAYVMRPASHSKITMKNVVCFAGNSYCDYATVEVGTSTYLLALSPEVMKEKCPSWPTQLVKRRKNAGKADHLRHKCTERDFKALKLILGIAHDQTPDLSTIPLANMHDLTIVAMKLGALRTIEKWAHNFLSQLKTQFEGGKAVDQYSSLSTVGWPCTLRLSVEFRHREMFAIASKHFIRKCRLVRAKESYWTFAFLSWEDSQFEMNTTDLFASKVITNIRFLLDNKKNSLGWLRTAKSCQMAAKRLGNHPYDFRKRAVVAALCRGELTQDFYTDASVDDIIAWIQDLDPKKSDTAAEARMILEETASNVDKMVRSRMDEMKFRFE